MEEEVRPKDILDQLYLTRNEKLATTTMDKLRAITQGIKLDEIRQNIRYEAFINVLPEDKEVLTTADLAELIPKVL
jgi:hypothetical protein